MSDVRLWTFASYRIRDIVDVDLVSTTYRATTVDGDELCRVRVFTGDVADAERVGDAVIAEARAASRIRHPHILGTFEAGRHGERVYVVSEDVHGVVLREYITRHQALDPRVALAIGWQLAEALDAVHAAGVVHGAINPHTVWVSDTPGRDVPVVYLSGFGSAGMLAAQVRNQQKAPASDDLLYIAPDQMRQERSSPEADRYALACAVYHLLTGVPPFRRDSVSALFGAHLFSNVEPPTTLRDNLSPALDTVFTRALAKDSGERYPSAHALLIGVERALHGRADSRGAAPAPHRGERPSRGRWTVGAAERQGARPDDDSGVDAVGDGDDLVEDAAWAPEGEEPVEDTASAPEGEELDEDAAWAPEGDAAGEWMSSAVDAGWPHDDDLVEDAEWVPAGEHLADASGWAPEPRARVSGAEETAPADATGEIVLPPLDVEAAGRTAADPAATVDDRAATVEATGEIVLPPPVPRDAPATPAEAGEARSGHHADDGFATAFGDGAAYGDFGDGAGAAGRGFGDGAGGFPTGPPPGDRAAAAAGSGGGSQVPEQVDDDAVDGGTADLSAAQHRDGGDGPPAADGSGRSAAMEVDGSGDDGDTAGAVAPDDVEVEVDHQPPLGGAGEDTGATALPASRSWPRDARRALGGDPRHPPLPRGGDQPGDPGDPDEPGNGWPLRRSEGHPDDLFDWSGERASTLGERRSQRVRRNGTAPPQPQPHTPPAARPAPPVLPVSADDAMDERDGGVLGSRARVVGLVVVAVVAVVAGVLLVPALRDDAPAGQTAAQDAGAQDAEPQDAEAQGSGGQDAAEQPAGGGEQQPPVEPLWRAAVAEDPVDEIVTSDETLVVSAGRGLSALERSSGTELWTARSAAPVEQLAVAGNVAVTLTGDGTTGYDLRDGEVLWRSESGADLPEALAAGPTEVFAVARATGGISLWSIGAEDGTSTPLGTMTSGADPTDGDVALAFDARAADAGDGMLYVLTNSGLYAFDPAAGAEAWRAPVNLDGEFEEPEMREPAWVPSLDAAAGTVFAVALDGAVCGYEAATGAEVWPGCQDLTGALDEAPRLDASDARVVVATPDAVAALDAASGTPRWEHALDGEVQPPAAGSPEVVYVAHADGLLEALERASGRVRWRAEGVGDVRALLADDEGVVIGGAGGEVVRLAPQAVG